MSPWTWLALSVVGLLVLGLLLLRPAQPAGSAAQEIPQVYTIGHVCPAALRLPSWIRSVPGSSRMDLGYDTTGYLGGPKGSQAVVGESGGWRLEAWGFQIITVNRSRSPLVAPASLPLPGRGVWQLVSGPHAYQVTAAWRQGGRCRSLAAATTVPGQTVMAAVVRAAVRDPTRRRFRVVCRVKRETFLCRARPAAAGRGV